MAEKINISVSKELKQKIEEKIKETNFKSISEYITFVLEQITSEIKTEKQAYTGEEETGISGGDFVLSGERGNNTPGYTEEEEEDLKKTLDDMGYI